jgi:hypothetical protein
MKKRPNRRKRGHERIHSSAALKVHIQKRMKRGKTGEKRT